MRLALTRLVELNDSGTGPHGELRLSSGRVCRIFIRLRARWINNKYVDLSAMVRLKSDGNLMVNDRQKTLSLLTAQSRRSSWSN